MKLPSEFDIGDPVFVVLTDEDENEVKIPAHVRVVFFTNAKVRYSLRTLYNETTLHNIDSARVVPRDGRVVKWDFDNYS